MGRSRGGQRKKSIKELADRVTLLLSNPPSSQLPGDNITFPGSYIRFVVCKAMGWTYQQYQKQPSWFIEQIQAYIQAENEGLEKRNNGKRE